MRLGFISLPIMQGAIALVKIFFSFFQLCVRLNGRNVPRGGRRTKPGGPVAPFIAPLPQASTPWEATTGAALED